MLNSKGEVKITDFGVSKCVENSTGRSVVGTVTYMYDGGDVGVPRGCR